MVLLHIITLVIPNVCLFRSICIRFGDKNFFSKKWHKSQILKNDKISKYVTLTYYYPCDPKFPSVSLYLLTVSEITFFLKMSKFLKISKYGAQDYI